MVPSSISVARLDVAVLGVGNVEELTSTGGVVVVRSLLSVDVNGWVGSLSVPTAPAVEAGDAVAHVVQISVS